MDYSKYKNTVPYSRATPKAWGEEESRLCDLFWHDVFKELQLDYYAPHADTLRNQAWSMGHSSGYQEVFNYALDLADFLRPIDPENGEMTRKLAISILEKVVEGRKSNGHLLPLSCVTSDISKGDYDAAWQHINAQDTACRELIPSNVYFWLRNLANQQNKA